MRQFVIQISGKPISKHRPRFAHTRAKKAYNDQRKEEDDFILQAKRQIPWKKPSKKPIALDIIFKMPVTKEWPKYKLKALNEGVIFFHTKRPDTSNLIKFVEDTLEGHIWSNDSQIAVHNTAKIYARNPETVIKIRELK